MSLILRGTFNKHTLVTQQIKCGKASCMRTYVRTYELSNILDLMKHKLYPSISAIFMFKRALHFITLLTELLNSITSCNCYRNTMNQSSSKRFTTCMTHPLLKLKLKCAILLVMHSVYNFFAVFLQLIKPYFIVFFGCNRVCILLHGPHPCIILTARAMLSHVSNVQHIRCLLLLY